ncbi:MAG: ribonuclease HI [Chloroflexi bacterium]|nr:ribonuclease HI [Chloroflexota bacterium]
MESLDQVTIYSDGGAAPNPGPGGWGAILIAANGAERELSGGEPRTTNNRMELTAAVEALRVLKRPCAVEFYTDSEYLRRGITEWLPAWQVAGWQRKGGHDVANTDLWQVLDVESRRHQIAWHWVKGHAGNRYNERVDRLATAAREKIAPPDAPREALEGEAQIAIRVSALPGGAGGWAARLALPGNDVETITGRAAATANRLELEAALAALQALPDDTPACVFCPSDYLYQGITRWIKGWQARGWTTKTGDPVKNADLWRALDATAAARPVEWAPARQATPDLADGLDQLAAQAARGET